MPTTASARRRDLRHLEVREDRLDQVGCDRVDLLAGAVGIDPAVVGVTVQQESSGAVRADHQVVREQDALNPRHGRPGEHQQAERERARFAGDHRDVEPGEPCDLPAPASATEDDGVGLDPLAACEDRRRAALEAHDRGVPADAHAAFPGTTDQLGDHRPRRCVALVREERDLLDRRAEAHVRLELAGARRGDPRRRVAHVAQLGESRDLNAGRRGVGRPRERSGRSVPGACVRARRGVSGTPPSRRR